MAKFKKGESGNPAGRPRGSKNKVDSSVKEWLGMLVDNNRAQFEKDLKILDPKDRLVILERIMSYVVPKMQSVSIEEQVRVEYEQLERLLNEMPDVAVDELFERIKKLKDEQKSKN